MEAHPCLMRFLTNLARLCASKSANGPRKNSFRPDSPSTTNFPRGRKIQSVPSPHRTWSVPDASSKPRLNLHFGNSALSELLQNIRVNSNKPRPPALTIIFLPMDGMSPYPNFMIFFHDILGSIFYQIL